MKHSFYNQLTIYEGFYGMEKSVLKSKSRFTDKKRESLSSQMHLMPVTVSSSARGMAGVDWWLSMAPL